MRSNPWYTQYHQLRSRVQEFESRFSDRCRALQVDPNVAGSEVWNDIVVRAVHESNWQEGIYVTPGRTQELALHVFDELGGIAGPHLDMKKLLGSHKRHVVAHKRKHISIDDIAAYNLSAAHMAVCWVAEELSRRQGASLVYALKQCEKLLGDKKHEMPAHVKEKLERGFELVDRLLKDTAEIRMPIAGDLATEGFVLHSLLDLEFEELLNPMRIDYIHFLHRIVLMGVADPRRCGVFRKKSVHVGDPNVLFSPPSLVPNLMEEFCKDFPTILPTTVKYDPILKAAQASYRFVRIHPYHDGNGRVSRLLMNLVLWGHHPPVYLKADKKGRHRYAQALRRANRGNIEPLGCLIAMALIEIYEKLIDAVKESPGKFGGPDT